MGELISALHSNFEGQRGEEIRQMCLMAPKYGNDIDDADEMVKQVGKLTASLISAEKNIFGYPYAVTRNGQGWHFTAGKRMGALPYGRKAGEPLPDGSLSPMQGMDTNGPTAVLSSALKADFKEAQAAILTQRFSKNVFKSRENCEKFIDLIETYFKKGGSYIQFNILGKDLLLEAKRNPEEYRDLVVRVGGYSAYFVLLSPAIQDELIRRTEQAFG
jgi:formate C-acetyltransferase